MKTFSLSKKMRITKEIAENIGMANKLCPFCGDPKDDYPNDGYAHHDCARDYNIYESMQEDEK